MKPRVYLAGPISGLEYGKAVDWRHHAQRMLNWNDIEAFSPMRAKTSLDDGTPINTAKSMDGSSPMRTSRGIMCRDYTDCTRAHALLVNFLGCPHISQGTAMELAWAYHLRIPVVCVAEATNPNIMHPMAQQTLDFRLDTLDEGIAQVKTLLMAGG